jgi:hypothetical protein
VAVTIGDVEVRGTPPEDDRPPQQTVSSPRPPPDMDRLRAELRRIEDRAQRLWVD